MPKYVYRSSDPPFWKQADYHGKHDPYRCLGIGISSPFTTIHTKFNERHRADDCHGSFESVQRVARVLDEDYRVFVSSTTGFHVHVGDSDRGFPMELSRDLWLSYGLLSLE